MGLQFPDNVSAKLWFLLYCKEFYVLVFQRIFIFVLIEKHLILDVVALLQVRHLKRHSDGFVLMPAEYARRSRFVDQV